MTEQTNKAVLYRKLAAIAGELETVEKDGKNRDQGYTYATPASVFRAIKPLLAKHQIAIVPMQAARQDVDTGRTSRSGTPYILTSVDMSYLILCGESGESITAQWSGVAGAYGDDKGNAKAQTIALRTFLIQLFQIPADDMENDPDASGPAPVARQQQPQRPARTEYVEAPTTDATAELKSLVTAAREANIKLPVSVAGKVPSKMTAEQIRIAVNDLRMAIERALPTEAGVGEPVDVP
jgi:hypothetical protein